MSAASAGAASANQSASNDCTVAGPRADAAPASHARAAVVASRVVRIEERTGMRGFPRENGRRLDWRR